MAVITQVPTSALSHKLDYEQALQKAQSEVATTEIAGKILSIVFEFMLIKFDDSMERISQGIPKFLSVIEAFVRAEKQVEMCLPAFPFKSANKAHKVFGILPDKAEELSLERLNSMCVRIGEIYRPGAELTIISDGIVYNDLLDVSDRDTWAYGTALRAMASSKGFTHLSFSRLQNLVSFPLPDKLEEITYVANATNFRRFLLNKYGRDDLDVNNEIATNPDTLMTYRGYCRFLESDLKHSYPLQKGVFSNHAYKRNVKYLAKEMLRRGYAFAGAVKNNYPNHLRLSIHQSTGEHKISVRLLETTTGYTTPWHCCVARTADGQWTSAPKSDLEQNPRMKIVTVDGRPSYFQEEPATAVGEIIDRVTDVVEATSITTSTTTTSSSTTDTSVQAEAAKPTIA